MAIGTPVYPAVPGFPGFQGPANPADTFGKVFQGAVNDFLASLEAEGEIGLGVVLIGAAGLIILAQTKAGGELVRSTARTGKSAALMIATRGLIK